MRRVNPRMRGLSMRVAIAATLAIRRSLSMSTPTITALIKDLPHGGALIDLSSEPLNEPERIATTLRSALAECSNREKGACWLHIPIAQSVMIPIAHRCIISFLSYHILYHIYPTLFIVRASSFTIQLQQKQDSTSGSPIHRVKFPSMLLTNWVWVQWLLTIKTRFFA